MAAKMSSEEQIGMIRKAELEAERAKLQTAQGKRTVLKKKKYFK